MIDSDWELVISMERVKDSPAFLETEEGEPLTVRTDGSSKTIVFCVEDVEPAWA